MNTQKIQFNERSVAGAIKVLSLKSMIDGPFDGKLHDRLLNEVERTGAVVADFAGAEVRDSSIFACLVEGLQLARRYGVDFFLASVTKDTVRMLRLFRLTDLFPIVGIRAEA